MLHMRGGPKGGPTNRGKDESKLGQRQRAKKNITSPNKTSNQGFQKHCYEEVYQDPCIFKLEK